MIDQFDGFDWDAGNVQKCVKHGVAQATIERLFSTELLVRPDVTHSSAERRFQAVGRIETGKAVFLVFTIRPHNGKTYIRPISARYMHRKEVKRYEEEVSRL